MKAGQFNIFEYLERLNEEAESGNLAGKDKEGLIIPDDNRKSYDWLKKEYDAKQIEVKVEISGSGASFKPGYDLQTNLDSVKDFKPGMFGEAKPAKTGEAPEEKDEKKPSLDPKKDTPSFTKGEGDAQKKELPKTNSPKDNIKNKEEGEDKAEDEEETENKEKKDEKPEVKKIDLKTKKQ